MVVGKSVCFILITGQMLETRKLVPIRIQVEVAMGSTSIEKYIVTAECGR